MERAWRTRVLVAVTVVIQGQRHLGVDDKQPAAGQLHKKIGPQA
jgi:hypothetical protein